MHAHEQAATDHSSGMKPGEIFFIKPARLEQYHGKRIAQRQHYGRARSRREIKWTCLLLNVYVKKDMCVLGEGRSGIAAHRDDLDLKTCDRGENPDQFLRLATGAQCQHDISIGDHSEVAVQSI